jgi:hypothetical protein
MTFEAALADAPFLDAASPAFSIRSEAVRRARTQSWFARTPYGLAVCATVRWASCSTIPA